MSNSPSTYRSIKPSQSYKRHISFKYHHSRNARGGKPRLTVRNDADKGIWVDAEYHQDLDREDSPKFEQPKAALRPRKRRESASIAKRRSTVVIDGLVLDGGYSGTVQSLKNKTSFIRENEDAERRRMVSKELEEVCEKAFNGCSLGSSLTTSSTVKSIGYTADESTNSHSIACSSPSIQIPIQSLYTNTLSSTENNLPFDTPIRKRSDDINTLRISQDEKNDPEKGCLDDVIEHLDRLMDSASKLRSIDQLRAVSHGGIPLGLGDSPAMMKQYLDQEERDHQRYLIARATLRNVSTPNPHRTPTVNRHGHQSKQPMSTNIALEPAPLNFRPKSSLRSPVDETPRSETRNTIHAVNEALRFDAPMPTPELRLPVDQRGVQDDKSKAASGGNWNTKFVGTSEPVTIKAVHEPKKKRSFLDIFTGKKNVKTDKNKDKFEDGKNLKAPGTPGALGTPGAFGTFTHPSVDVLDTEKGTFGRRSGNALRRFVSRDAKMELGLANNASGESAGSNMALNSMLDGGNSLVSCFSPVGHLSDEEVGPVLESQNEFARVMNQRNWFQRVLNVKPASRIIHCSISALQCRKEILKLYKDWLKHGLIIVEDDRRGLVLRARVGSPNSLNIKEVSFVGEIRTHNGTRRTGTSLVQFTQEKGAASSFNRVLDEIVLACSLKGLLAQDEHN
ncbi:serine/threonine-protein kinase gin4 [Maublancomyces gigas]|uniref:non-specific serine/threonine protein kinase n=1 Tax=Discina gigas TaxID=1032678 RepID=A0ABR3GLF5_9PEZI